MPWEEVATQGARFDTTAEFIDQTGVKYQGTVGEQLAGFDVEPVLTIGSTSETILKSNSRCSSVYPISVDPAA